MSRTVSELEYLRPAQVSMRFPISRARVYELVAQGKIKSHVLRKVGNVRGARLISVESLRAYIESCPSK
jgi:hypothetical protein